MRQWLLLSGVLITKWGRVTLSGAGITVHLRDTKTNGDPCLLTGLIPLESGVV